MPEKWVYSVVAWTSPSDPVVVRVSATSEEEATRKVEGQFPGKSTVILSVRKVKTLEDNCLDLLWQAYPDLYLELWEPNMSTTQMLKKLKRMSPALYEGFMEW